jgi:hypothetical protein
MDPLVYAFFLARWGGAYKRPINPERPIIQSSR